MENVVVVLHQLNKLTFSSFHFDKGPRSGTVGEMNWNAQCRSSLVSKKYIKTHCTMAESHHVTSELSADSEENQLILFRKVRSVATATTSSCWPSTRHSTNQLMSCKLMGTPQGVLLFKLSTRHFIFFFFSKAAGGKQKCLRRSWLWSSADLLALLVAQQNHPRLSH